MQARGDQNNAPTMCYLLCSTAFTPGLEGDPIILPLTPAVHMRVAPWMCPLAPPAFQKRSAEDARKHTRIWFNYLMRVPDNTGGGYQ